MRSYLFVSLGFAPVLSLVVALASLGHAASAVTVDCNAMPPDKIQDALDAAEGNVIVTIDGFCEENVIISHDNVTLQGGTGYTVDGIDGGGGIGIHIIGATNTAITGLKIEGRTAVQAERNAAVDIENCYIDSSRTGVMGSRGAFVGVEGSHVSAARRAFQFTDGGNLLLRDNTITNDNFRSTIALFREILLRMRGGNTVTNDAPGRFALEVHSSTVLQGGNHDIFTGGVVSENLSYVELTNAEVTGRAIVIRNGFLRLADTSNDQSNVTWTGDIFVDGQLSLVGPLTLDGDITCNPLTNAVVSSPGANGFSGLVEDVTLLSGNSIKGCPKPVPGQANPLQGPALQPQDFE